MAFQQNSPDDQLTLDYPDAAARVTFTSADTIAFGRQSLRRRGRMHQRGKAEDVVVTLLPITLCDTQREVSLSRLALVSAGVNAVTPPQLVHRQIIQLRGLKHPRILPFYGAAAVGSHHLAVVSPFMKGGNLLEYAGTTYPEDRIRLVTELVEALQYLHENVDMVHGHLKPSKVLVSERGSVQLSVVTAFYYDTGPSTELDLRPAAGLRYTAPELLLTREASKTAASDVYACGMLIYETIAGVHPLAHFNDRQAIAALARGTITLPPAGGMNRELWNLCRNCCSMSPSSRPSANSILWTLRRIGRLGQSYAVARSQRKPHPGKQFQDSEERRHGEESSGDGSDSQDASSPTSSVEGSSGPSESDLEAEASSDEELSIVVPRQKPIQGGMAVVLKGYASVSGTVQCMAIKILKTFEPENIQHAFEANLAGISSESARNGLGGSSIIPMS
ncbi:kinase-like protein [Auricularia subglabra TFB-10046 SS5]|nr:kinase-like protein [Auricularia subglabra TFB-10046 SS5]